MKHNISKNLLILLACGISIECSAAEGLLDLDKDENRSGFENKVPPLVTKELQVESLGYFQGLLRWSLKFIGINDIPNFSGNIYQKGDRGYIDKIKQYATTSYSADKMTPFMVAYPANEHDIKWALKFALENGKKVVARSGGHQYSGKSSGNQDTIVLSMDNFTTFKRLENGLVEVGPCVKLTDLASQFKKWHITIPHGICPQVNIGGHAQTGGYGHLKRSFGLAADYVQAFDIILADGSLKTVTRPKVLPETDEERLNQEIFRGVLGGNAGSFGIITKYFLNCIKDEDHKRSWGESNIRAYNNSVFKDLMKEAQEWTQLIERKEDDKLLEGLDFMLSVESGTWPLPPILLVELVYSDPHNNVPYNGQFDSIIKKAKGGRNLLTPILD